MKYIISHRKKVSIVSPHQVPHAQAGHLWGPMSLRDPSASPSCMHRVRRRPQTDFSPSEVPPGPFLPVLQTTKRLLAGHLRRMWVTPPPPGGAPHRAPSKFVGYEVERKLLGRSVAVLHGLPSFYHHHYPPATSLSVHLLIRRGWGFTAFDSNG